MHRDARAGLAEELGKDPAFVEQLFRKLAPEERLKGLDPEERLKGLDPAIIEA